MILWAICLSYSPNVLFVFPFLSITQSTAIKTKSPYERGVEKVRQGDWPAAITIWGTALQKQEVQHSIELKMAVKYIQTVTEHKDDQYYENACTYYLNAFRQASWSREPKALSEELARLMPIVPRKLKKKWKKEIKKKDPAIFDQVVVFWERMDPIISTSVNERLIEHWRRIAYARKHFTRTHNTIYHTDDRGLIYVRFGKPDLEEKNVVLPPNQIVNPVTGGPLIVDGMTFRPAIPLILETDLWEYQFSNRSQPSFYLFGTNAKGGGYGLQVGIMHMIPSFGYSLPLAGINRIGGELVIKYAMIGKLIGVTGYYDKIYNDLTNAFISRSMQGISGGALYEAPGILYQYENQEVQQSLRRDIKSPASTTSLVTGSNLISINYKYFRYLNDKNRPEYLLMMNPNLKKLYKFLKKNVQKKHPVEQLSMRSSLLAIDNTGHRHVFGSHDLDSLQIQKTRGTVSYFFDPDSTGTNLITGIDFFGNVGEKVQPTNVLKALFNRSKNDSIVYQGVHPIFSSGPMQIPLPKPLTWKPGQILISDPVLGHRQKIESNKRIPFTPELEPTFWNGDEILVFFEVYDRDVNNYSVDISYERFRNMILMKKTKPYNRSADVIVHFKRDNTHDRKWFFLKINGFEVGNYNLKMTVKNDKGKVQDVRTVGFKIREKEADK